ncbi:hypothetical protein IFR05_010189 [Cadophora sp. M221]|nr:hypothetical protein IFR05_010189 [Cadophora sp. M221]
MERILKNLSVAQLVKYDKDFGDLMWNLEGIQEWWIENRVEWIKHRDELHACQATLDSLITQMKAAERSKSWDQNLRLKNACTQQKKDIQFKERWFPENKYLMKLVMDQFQRVQKGSQKLNAIISQRADARQPVAPDCFSFGTAPPEDTEMFKTTWFHRNGYRWWLTIAAGHLEHCIQEYKLQKELRIKALDETDDELVQLNTALAQLQREERYEADYNKMYLDDRVSTSGPPSSSHWKSELAKVGQVDRKKAAVRERNICAKQVAIDQLKYDRYEDEFMIHRASTLTEREASILYIIRSVLEATEDNTESLLPSSTEFAKGLYYVCCVQGLYTQILAKIEAILNDDALHNSDKAKILDSYELPRESSQKPRYHHELLIQTLDKAVLFQSDLKDARESILYQFTIANKTLDLAKSLQQRTGLIQFAQSSSQISGLLNTPSTPTPVQQSATWGPVQTYEQAVSILSRRHQDPYQDPGWFLRQFFVSPDIAPHFQWIHKISRNEFLALANSFPQEDFLLEEIEAFLRYCTFVGDLFTMSGKFVSAYKHGWELIDEMPIDSTPRAVGLAKPPGLDDMFSWLMRNQQKCNLVSSDRNTTESQLLHMISLNYPRGNNFTLKKLQDILGWLDKSGQLYRYTERQNRKKETIIRRIDNGWGPIDVHQEYDAIFDPNEPQTYFKALRSIIQREDVQNTLREAMKDGGADTEREIYNLIEPYLKVKRLSGLANTIITRHRFHLYLRWCDQIGDGMSLRRDGKVLGAPRKRSDARD